MKPWEYSVLQEKCRSIERDLTVTKSCQLDAKNNGHEMDVSDMEHDAKYDTNHFHQTVCPDFDDFNATKRKASDQFVADCKRQKLSA